MGSAHAELPLVEVELLEHLHAASIHAILTMLMLLLMLPVMMSATTVSETAMC